MRIFAEIEALHCPVTQGAGFLFLVDMFNFSKVQRLARNQNFFQNGAIPNIGMIHIILRLSNWFYVDQAIEKISQCPI